MLNIVQLEPLHLPFSDALSGHGAAWVQYWLRTGTFLTLHTKSRDFGLSGILGKGVTKDKKFNGSSLNI